MDKKSDYNIVLIGFMGSGKSTVAKELKIRYGMEIVEMDKLISDREGMSIADIFKTHGEQYFRNAETELLKEMQTKSNTVISCGGGTPLRECNVTEMRKIGKIVWLTATADTIYGRVKDNHDRPLLENNMNPDYIRKMMEDRHDRYAAASDIIVETDGKSMNEICDKIIDKIEHAYTI